MSLRKSKSSESDRVATSIQTLLDDIASDTGRVGVSSTIVNLLVPLEFEVHATKNNGREGDLRYVLMVRHRSAHTTWHHRRSFDEYESFQRQVISALHHGHLCSGDCPWLESFLGAASATTTRSLSAMSSTVVERRRKTLLSVMQALQRFMTNRANHSCTHTLHGVARAFLEFIYGGVIDSAHVMDKFLCFAASASAPSMKTDGIFKDSTITKRAQRRLRAQSSLELAAPTSSSTTTQRALLTSKSSVVGPPTAVVASVGKPEECAICGELMPVKDLYVVRLQCGHRFHDECAMPKLNERLQCPTCQLQLTSTELS